jgi:hypothetical protein
MVDEIDIGRGSRDRTSALVWGDLQGAQPVEDGIAVHLGPHQSLLDGDELLEFDEAGRLSESPPQSCKVTARNTAAITTLEG